MNLEATNDSVFRAMATALARWDALEPGSFALRADCPSRLQWASTTFWPVTIVAWSPCFRRVTLQPSWGQPVTYWRKRITLRTS